MATSDLDRIRAANEKKREKIAQARVEARAKENQRTEDLELKAAEAESLRLDAELAQAKSEPLSKQLADAKKKASETLPSADEGKSAAKADSKSNGGN